MKRWSFSALTLMMAAVSTAWAQDPLLDLLKTEMDREMAVLQKQEVPPYYMLYRVDELRRVSLGAAFGALTQDSSHYGRNLNVQVRTGDPKLDSSRELRGDWLTDWSSSFRVTPTPLPLEDHPEALRLALWKATERAYRAAVDRLAKVKTNEAVRVAAEDKSADFTQEDRPEVFAEAAGSDPGLDLDKGAWIETLKAVTKVFRDESEILEGTASLDCSHTRQYLVSSEGTRIVQNHPSFRISLSGQVKADDGMELPLHQSYFGFSLQELPKRDKLLEDARIMVGKLKALRKAPVVEPFNGPAILSGKAAGVFFHEIFGHRIEGHRQKREEEGQTFKKKLNERLLPESLQVYCDPSLKTYKSFALSGHYVYDDEGIKGRRVDIIQNGILKGFLMGRNPIEGFNQSNGHGRAQMGFRPVSRQSNLIIESTKPLPFSQLKARLVEACKAQNKPFGLLFVQVEGGFTMTGRFMPNAFNVLPTEVYRIYADGRPDELVRGVDLVGTPLMVFSNIQEAGDDPDLFVGTCGAESGGVPVSSVSPSLLLSQIEVQKKDKSKDKAPILPRPSVEGGR